MEINTNIMGNSINFKIIGAINTESGTELSNKFVEVTGNSPLKNAVFDLSEVQSITSAGIGKLLKFYKHFDKLGGQMRIKGISESLKKQFEEIHLDMIISIEE